MCGREEPWELVKQAKNLKHSRRRMRNLLIYNDQAYFFFNMYAQRDEKVVKYGPSRRK